MMTINIHIQNSASNLNYYDRPPCEIGPSALSSELHIQNSASIGMITQCTAQVAKPEDLLL